MAFTRATHKWQSTLQEHARAQALYLRSHCHTLLAKVASFEQRTLVDTYTADSIPALDAIARELTGAIDRAESDSREVRSLKTPADLEDLIFCRLANSCLELVVMKSRLLSSMHDRLKLGLRVSVCSYAHLTSFLSHKSLSLRAFAMVRSHCIEPWPNAQLLTHQADYAITLQSSHCPRGTLLPAMSAQEAKLLALRMLPDQGSIRRSS